jgi:hypothetical protein
VHQDFNAPDHKNKPAVQPPQTQAANPPFERSVTLPVRPHGQRPFGRSRVVQRWVRHEAVIFILHERERAGSPRPDKRFG